MAKALTSAQLRKLADDMDAEERAEEEVTLRERIDRLEAALASGGLTDDQRTTLERAEAMLNELEAADRRDDQEHEEEEPDGTDDDNGRKPRKPTRPGRKRGHAYAWDVDEDGNVVKLSTAKVWGGDDEPDRVELPDDDGEGDE